MFVLNPCQRLKPLPGETFGEKRYEVGNRGVVGKLGAGRFEASVDRLLGEHIAEFGL